MRRTAIITFLMRAAVIFAGCQQSQQPKENENESRLTWAERLGYPPGKKVIMLHADDAGLSEEANIATQHDLLNGYIQSAAAMPPCPAFEEMIEWAIQNPSADVGLHLTHTSEWKTYRWAPVSDAATVPGLIDPEGKMWRSVREVVQHATPAEVEKEIRGQIEKSLALGYRPDHIDTHMGTLYGHPEYAKAFMKVAMEYRIPANAIDLSDSTVAAHFRASGYPLTDELISFMKSYTLPQLDFFTSVPEGDTYDEKLEKFKLLIRQLRPGLTEIIFHPSVYSDRLKTITNSWQQRVWEAEMFSDPQLLEFFKEEGIIFTNWKEIMARFEKRAN